MWSKELWAEALEGQREDKREKQGQLAMRVHPPGFLPCHCPPEAPASPAADPDEPWELGLDVR